MPQGTNSFPLFGGLDLVSSALTIPPGRVIAALNYEPTSEGYTRIRGYERFSGLPAPSDATYWRINFTSGYTVTGVAPAVGDWLVDYEVYPGVSQGNAYIVASVVTSGSYAGGDAVGYLVVTSLTGVISGAMLVSGLLTGTATTTTLEYDFGATQNAAYLATARTVARSNIAAVTGSGAIRGIWVFEDTILAFRDNAGGSAGTIWKATTSGWTQITFSSTIFFTCDTATQTLPTALQAISHVSGSAVDGVPLISSVKILSTVGTVNTCYMIVTGGTPATNFTAAGQTIYREGFATQFGTTTAAATATTLPAGGRYFFINHNFYGAEDLAAMYGVNGVGKAFTYDGTHITFISTGMTTDTPTRLAAHRNSLFLSFPGGSLQFSSVGEPSVFDAVVGAGEIGVGSDITDLIPANKTTLAILAEDTISVLYGNDSTDYLLDTLTDEAGALPFTAQRLAQVVYMDSAGIRTLSSAATYGDYNFGSLSQLIAPLLADYLEAGTLPVVSFKVRRKNQYWVFFSDGTGLVAHLGRKTPEWLPFNLGFTPTCGCSVEVSGEERIFLGSSNGYVYEFNKGTSFDGSVIPHSLQLPYAGLGAPRVDKRMFEFAASMVTDGAPTLSCAIGINGGRETGLVAQTFTITEGTTGEGIIDGGIVARDFSATFSGSTSTEEPHTLTDATYYVAPRRLVRG